ncbi:MAG TPA: DUF488 family protein [Marmoricola sp.]|nr:DUF488 family protein [Marmoricola sp.]HNJ78398.1 DUF488 family protein [Marmoricola sp.]HNN47643.1 DUF488 family protein [Marmoricola sp.]HNO40474.1 DUF488 family protein [Marmoricola sp.]
MNSGVQVRRIYDAALPTDGYRVLVDRLWPRGLAKEKAHYDEWCRDAAPSAELRNWYAHDPEKLSEFQERYLAELSDGEHVEALDSLREKVASGLTLLTATKDLALSQAQVLADYLNQSTSSTQG